MHSTFLQMHDLQGCVGTMQAAQAVPAPAQAAMNNMTNELMLLGVATLILLAFQKDIGHICSALVTS